jgi:hypothetical protein
MCPNATLVAQGTFCSVIGFVILTPSFQRPCPHNHRAFILLLILTPAGTFSEFGLGSSLEMLFRVAEDQLPRSLPGALAYKVD